LELDSKPEELTFKAIHVRLLAFVNARVQSGEFSERSLAKRLGVSQPQLHNVLKGARKLQPELADAMLTEFRISVLDLLTKEERALQGAATRSLLLPETGRLRLLRKQLVSSQIGNPPRREAS